MTSTPEIKVLFDGACPICRREMQMIRRRDQAGRIEFVDIAATDFDPTTFGLTQARVMDRIHALLPDGSTIEGVEVFRRIYRIIGKGWLMSWTGWPILRPIADAAYRLFARHRLRLTGRHACADGRCATR